VVADEVRNLALRAADAAKNTANLIEGTVKKVNEGSEIVERTNAEFSQVEISAGKMGELIGEISAASGEQAQGIGQISKAVSEMDRVVQQNAGSAEESASASEELNAQANQMKNFVGELVAMVGGSANGFSQSRKAKPAPFAKSKPVNGKRRSQDTSNPEILKTISKPHNGKETLKTAFVRPEQMIPFGDEQLPDF
jgi:methyl-accepting chemotaxis protein